MAERCGRLGVPYAVAAVVQEGGAGGEDLAQTVLKVLEERNGHRDAGPASGPRMTGDCLSRRSWKFSREDVYGADGVVFYARGQAGHQSVRGAGRGGLARVRGQDPALHLGSARA